MENLNSELRKLGNILNEKKSDVDKLIIDKNKAESLFFEIDIKTKQTLNRIFGDEKDINQITNFNQIFSFEKNENSYSDAIIYSYWSYRGESDIYSKEAEGNWRRNFFYKGTRWSNSSDKNNFYHFFKYFEEVTNGFTTVEFFVDLGIRFNKRHFVVSIDKEIKNEDNKFSFPDYDFIKNQNIQELTTLVENIEQYREIIGRNEVNFKNAIAKQEFSFEKFKSLYESAYEKSKDASFINDVKNKLSDYFGSDWENSYRDSNKIVFGILMTLLFFDHPYDIHFFLPNNTDNLTKASLIITIKKGLNIKDDYITYFEELIDVLKIQSEIEREIVNKLKSILPNYLRFKDKYSKIVDKYERLSEIVINIVKAIAYNNDIEFTYELYRVKDFDSFFEKIVKIANNKDDTRHNLFYDILINVKTDKLDDICKELSDISGARIVCLFQDEAEIIVDELDKLANDGEIMIIEKVDYIQSETKNDISKFGYRSKHRILKLGEKRLNIYEFKDLANIKSELQIRTLLADVWANASHQLFYKKKFPDKFDEINNIKSTFYGISADLKNKDETLKNIKKEIHQLILKHLNNEN